MKIVFVLIMAAFLSGCAGLSPNQAVIEEISPIILMYLDEDDNSALQSTIVIPAARDEKKQVMTVRGSLVLENKDKLNHRFYRQIRPGQLRMLFFSEELAKKGRVMQRLNAFLRVPEISGRLRLAVVRGDFESFLQSQINRQEGIDVYLYKMFKHYERQGDMAIVNAHLFLESYYSPYSDPILPMFTVEQNQLVYAGSALFQNDRLVKTIPVEDDHLFQTIACARRFHSHIPLPEHNIVLGKMFSTRQIRFADRYHEGVVTVRLRGRVEEYTGDKDLSDPEQAASLTRELEQHLEERLRKQIREFQKLSIDPMQFGLRTLNLFRQPFSGSEWKRRWLELPVTVRVELALDNFGSVKVKPKNRDRVNVSDSREELP